MDSNFIKELAYSFGVDVCGVANIERFEGAPKGFHPLDICSEAKSVISFGKHFSIRGNGSIRVTRGKVENYSNKLKH
jgi:hypothetical protein